MKKTLLLIGIATALSGCKMLTLPHELRQVVQDEQKDATAKTVTLTPNVYHFDAFYVPMLDEKDRALPDWYFKQEKSGFRTSTVGKISRLLQMNHGFSIEYRVGADGDRPVSGIMNNESVGDVLDAISKNTGYQYDIIDNTLVWRKYAEEIFPIRGIAGEYDYSIGKRNSTSSGTSNNSGSSSNNNYAQAGAVTANGDEYSNVSGKSNPIVEFLDGIESVLGCNIDALSSTTSTTTSIPSIPSINGAFKDISETTTTVSRPNVTIESLEYSAKTEKIINNWRCDEGAEVKAFSSDNSIYVRALPSQLDSVRTFVKDKTERSMRSVRIDITLLTVTKKKSSVLDLEVDLQDIIMGGKGVLSTITNSTSAIIGGLTDTGKVKLAHNSGTDLLIQALQEDGDILQRTSMKGIAMNNRIGNFTNVDKISFISDRSVQTTSNVGATSGITQSVAESGVLLYMLPNIGKDNVIVHLSSSLSDLVSITKKGEVGSEVESPQISDRIFNTTLVLEPGRPVLASGSSFREIQAITSQSGFSGYAQSGVDQNTEILMIVEAVFL
jgi:MSHA biogenesis protein MshL